MKQVCRGQVPNMLKLLDYFEDDVNFYIVTKYFPQGDLHEYVVKKYENGDMPEIVAKHILRQLVTGIKALHERNILHRDIKEANVLVKKKGNKLRVWLADFGLSTQLESRTATRDVPIGTIDYMAPEMCKHEPYGLPIDIWALGTLMYQLLTKSTPFCSND